MSLPTFTCADCGESFHTAKSPFCSVCRPYHPHTFAKPDASMRRQGLNGCSSCGLAQDAEIHQ